MHLLFADGRPFATGKQGYHSIQTGATASRILLQVRVEKFVVQAILDTASTYFVCSLSLASLLKLDPEYAIDKIPVFRIRGIPIQGGIYRLPVTFLADEGIELTLDVPAFVPDPGQDIGDELSDLSFIGLRGCLENFRFGIDPWQDEEMFYFGT